MKYRKSTIAWRAQFAEAAAHIWNDRARFFNDPRNVNEIITRLRSGKAEALRDVARELRKRGIYSGKTALCTIEHALMVRLFHAKEAADWPSFVRSTVGLGWLKELEGDRRAA